MATNFTLPEDAKITQILKPATDAAGRTGRWVKVTGAHKIYLVFMVDQGNAATILLTPKQASDSSGTGAKAIAGARIWACLDVAASDALARQTDAANYTTDAGVKEKVVIFEIDPAYLDVVNGFVWVTLVTGASNAGNLTQAGAYATPLRDHAASPPTMTA